MNKIGATKLVKQKMANTVAYPDLALEKFIGIDSSEDPTALIRFSEKKISFSLGSRPATNEKNIQTVYDDRRKALFGSVLRGPSAEWFDSLQATLRWDPSKTHWLKDNLYTIIYRFFLTHMDRHEWTLLSRLLKDNSCFSTPNLLGISPDSGIPQYSPHTPLSFQPESPVTTSQPTTPSPLPRTSSFSPTNLPSTSTGTTPRSRNAGTLRNIPREWYGKPYF